MISNLACIWKYVLKIEIIYWIFSFQFKFNKIWTRHYSLYSFFELLIAGTIFGKISRLMKLSSLNWKPHLMINHVNVQTYIHIIICIYIKLDWLFILFLSVEQCRKMSFLYFLIWLHQFWSYKVEISLVVNVSKALHNSYTLIW